MPAHCEICHHKAADHFKRDGEDGSLTWADTSKDHHCHMCGKERLQRRIEEIEVQHRHAIRNTLIACFVAALILVYLVHRSDTAQPCYNAQTGQVQRGGC